MDHQQTQHTRIFSTPDSISRQNLAAQHAAAQCPALCTHHATSWVTAQPSRFFRAGASHTNIRYHTNTAAHQQINTAAHQHTNTAAHQHTPAQHQRPYFGVRAAFTSSLMALLSAAPAVFAVTSFITAPICLTLVAPTSATAAVTIACNSSWLICCGR